MLEMLTATAAVADAPIEPTIAVSAREAIQIRNCSRIAGHASIRIVRVRWRWAESDRMSGVCDSFDCALVWVLALLMIRHRKTVLF